MTVLLKANKLSAGYAGQPVITDCSLEAQAGQAIAIVGRNGAGKTTLVSAISGRLPLMAGELFFADQSIGHLPAFRRCRAGLIHVPQGREVFARLTVRENLLIAAHAQGGAEWDLVYELFPILKERMNQAAGTLSGGEQQMLALGRAVMRRASLMILDEPSLGLAPKVVETVFERIRRLRASTLNTTLILVEQQARWVWEAGMVDYVYVLLDGMIVASGSPDVLPENIVQDSYLGKANVR